MKIFKYYLLIIGLSLLPFIGIFLTQQLPHTSDGAMQVVRMGAFYKALVDYHFPVRWAGDLNYGYGMPLFIFIYHTPFYIGALFIALGINLVTSFKLILTLSFILSGITMFAFANAFWKDKRTALFVTILYQFAPFHLIEILVRGSAGGIYAYAFLPLILLAMVKAWEKPSAIRLSFISIATALMIISHNSLALVFFGICVLFLFVFAPNKRLKIYTLIALSGGLGLAAYFWIPALFEHKYTYGDLFMKDLFRANFPPWQNFFIPNIFDAQALRVNATSEISTHIGIIHTVALFGGIFLLICHKITERKEKLGLLLMISLLSISLFLMLPVSTFLWERINWLRQFQFPWRLLAVVTLATSFMGASLLRIQFFRKPIIFTLLCAITVVATMHYWQPTQGYDTVIEKDFWDYPLNTTYFGETDVIWSAGPAKSYPKERIEVIEGSATISNTLKKNQWQSAIFESTTSAKLVSNTQYFPGWRVTVDKKPVPIEFQDQLWRGLITFNVPAGRHEIDIRFGESKIRIFADLLSAISLISLLVYCVLFKNKKHT